MILSVHVSSFAEQVFHYLGLPFQRSAHQLRIASVVFLTNDYLCSRHYVSPKASSFADPLRCKLSSLAAKVDCKWYGQMLSLLRARTMVAKMAVRLKT